MPFDPTQQQRDIICAEIGPQCIIACPGSGKTATAVRRLLEIRKRLSGHRGCILLLSYSNVAVDTFRAEYQRLAKEIPGLSTRVRIETADSFLTNFILRPHAARTMSAKRQPFLVNGSEAFLAGFKVWDGNYPRDIQNLTISVTNGGLEFFVRENSTAVKIDRTEALCKIARLGKVGAYTHEIGRYWALQTLIAEPRLLRVLARKFPIIIVDEAQDVGSLQGAMLDALAKEGATISLVGDPNQAIFEFAGATGEFLRDYEKKDGVAPFPLTQNRRSIESIVKAANKAAGTASVHFRDPPARRSGVFYLKYDPNKLSNAVPLFEAILSTSGYEVHEAAMLCRGRPYVAALTGTAGESGSGATALFADATVLRDRSADIATAFERVISGVVRLLNDPPVELRSTILVNGNVVNARLIRSLVWSFLKDRHMGLPPSTLKASSEWLPKLKKNLDVLLGSIETKTSLNRLPSWASNVTKRDLVDEPLWQADLASSGRSKIRIDTVHKAKGESIGAVMYVARTEEINALVKGTATELGRIGYVAVTRAADLMILAVPVSAKPKVIKEIETLGFEPWSS